MKTKTFQFLVAAVLTLVALAMGPQAFAISSDDPTFTIPIGFQSLIVNDNKNYECIISGNGKTASGGWKKNLNPFSFRDDNNNLIVFDLSDKDFPLSLTISGAVDLSHIPYVAVPSTMVLVITFTAPNHSIVGAAVTKDNVAVEGSTVTISNHCHTCEVVINKDKEFNKVILTFASHTPLSEGATIEGIQASYIDDGVNRPVPTAITYRENSNSPVITLTEGTDYTLSYNVGSTKGVVIVDAAGKYYGSIFKEYEIRQLALSDFHRLSDGSYEIASKDDLDRLAKFVNKGNDCQNVTFTQTANISYDNSSNWNDENRYQDNGNGTISVVSGCENNFTPIGGFSKPFKGTFDGGNFTISGIRIFRSGTTDADRNQGLFGYVNGGTVKRVILKDASIYGYHSYGGIVGYISGNAKVIDCQLQQVCVASGDDTKTNFVVGFKEGNNPSITGTQFLDCYIGTMVQVGSGIYAQQNTRCDIITVNPKSAQFAGQTHHWGTFYNKTGNFRLPAGAKAFTMNSDKALYLVGDGSIIPVGCAVVIMADTESITLTLTDATATPENNNILRGVVANTAKAALAGSKQLYVLCSSSNTLGFFVFFGTTVPANKAYYVE